MPFSALGAKIFAGISAALLIALAFMAWQNNRLAGKLDKCREDKAVLQGAADVMIADGAKRLEEGKRAVAASVGRIERIDRVIERIVPQASGACPTPDAVMQGVAEGWTP